MDNIYIKWIIFIGAFILLCSPLTWAIMGGVFLGNRLSHYYATNFPKK